MGNQNGPHAGVYLFKRIDMNQLKGFALNLFFMTGVYTYIPLLNK